MPISHFMSNPMLLVPSHFWLYYFSLSQCGIRSKTLHLSNGLFVCFFLPTQIFGTSAGPGTPRVRAPPLLFQKEWEEYKNLPHSNLKTSVVNLTSWEQVGGKKDSFCNFCRKKLSKKYVYYTGNAFLVGVLSWI